jgi:DNA-binding response OmpR family regulator
MLLPNRVEQSASNLFEGNCKDVVLVVEDCQIMQRTLRRLFESGGMEVRVVSDGVAAVESFQKQTPSAVLLDMKIPGLPGREVCHVLKAQNTSVPVVVVSAIIEVSEKVLLLELGADDYITKPFSPKELLARVRRFLRPAKPTPQNFTDVVIETVPHERLAFSDVKIDFTSMEATRSGAPVKLATQEFEILKCFSRSPDKVFSREELLNQVWGCELSPEPRLVDKFIFRLRQKLEPDPGDPRHFLLLRGAGYKFRCGPLSG